MSRTEPRVVIQRRDGELEEPDDDVLDVHGFEGHDDLLIIDNGDEKDALENNFFARLAAGKTLGSPALESFFGSPAKPSRPRSLQYTR